MVFIIMHVQYIQTDTNRQNTLTSGTISKWSPFVKEALRFVPLVRMESSSVDYLEPCERDLLIGAIGTNRLKWKSSQSIGIPFVNSKY